MTEQSFRDRLQGDLDERYEKLVAAIDSALEAKKLVWVSCPSCKKRSEVEVQDTKAAIAAAEFVANRAHGRPGVATEDPDAERIKFLRIIAYDGIGPDQFEELKERVEGIVSAATEIASDLRTALVTLTEDLADIADQHRDEARA